MFNMYVVINKKNNKIIAFREANNCAGYLSIGRTTLYYWFKDKNTHETINYIIYKADEVYLNSNRGAKKR